MHRHILPMERWKFFCYTVLGFLVAPVILWVAWRRKKNYSSRAQAPRVLVVPILTRLGDLVCSTVVFRAIKMQYPGAHITVLVGGKVVDILKANKRHDAHININDIPFKGFWGRGKLFWFIFTQQFDVVVSLTNNPFNNLVNWFSASPIRIKTVVENRSRAEYVTDIFSNRKLLYKSGVFLQGHYVALLQYMGVPFSTPIKELSCLPESDIKVTEFLTEHGVRAGDILVGITPSAGHKAKEWPVERFSAVAQYVTEKYQAKVVLIDSLANKERVERVIKHTPETMRGRFIVATQFSLSDLPSVIKRLDIFIAVDTGNIYVAHAVGVPLIDITGPVNADDQAPNDSFSIHVKPPEFMKPVFSVLQAPDVDAYQKASVMVNAIAPEHVFLAFDCLMKVIKNRFKNVDTPK